MEPQESERFEEGSDSEFQNAEEPTTRETETHNSTITETLGSGEFHGRYGSASLRECIERALQQDTATPATLHSGRGLGAMTNPPQVLGPNVEQSQSQKTTSVNNNHDASLRPLRRERKEEDVTPKSEPSQVEVKEEPKEQDSEEPAGPEEQEEKRTSTRRIPSSTLSRTNTTTLGTT